ncbi:MAG TPA: Sir2 family NAD-dependent protein deacetylase [Terriglobales bacterium]|nr:Sir2 family NAD-dependent protein deacetylase [Terriglobales bacterium]
MVSLLDCEKLFVLTGAGTSADSGLATFRGEGGVWRTYRAEEVANINAWRRDPRLVWDFYSMRRAKHREVQPNAAHFALAQLEQILGDRFFLCTQNVDQLHELAGSKRIAHIHGKIFESKCDSCDRPPFFDDSPYASDQPLPKCDCGGGVRPNVCWFGEVPFDVAPVMAELNRCDAFMAVGTSGMVEPVASFVAHLKQRREPVEGRRIHTVYVGLEEPRNAGYFDDLLLGKAAEVLPALLRELEATG